MDLRSAHARPPNSCSASPPYSAPPCSVVSHWGAVSQQRNTAVCFPPAVDTHVFSGVSKEWSPVPWKEGASQRESPGLSRLQAEWAHLAPSRSFPSVPTMNDSKEPTGP
ncbi:hypothetical protein NHX12_003912 [Muraenolepis orangiensis]|uniref:Uncharacterized protein n=1 Tax=Muraenolepis orangiensis TaxID=630683 RepID=A0A9Q0DWS6_9TELE|nr:hypothetical protein NHX12_003912 [Muraenolepis orangiensis]